MNDGLDACRGVMVGLLIAGIMWVGIGYIIFNLF
jgi:hypothetical protein